MNVCVPVPEAGTPDAPSDTSEGGAIDSGTAEAGPPDAPVTPDTGPSNDGSGDVATGD
jgi:hypothetical protein